MALSSEIIITYINLHYLWGSEIIFAKVLEADSMEHVYLRLFNGGRSPSLNLYQVLNCHTSKLIVHPEL